MASEAAEAAGLEDNEPEEEEDYDGDEDDGHQHQRDKNHSGDRLSESHEEELSLDGLEQVYGSDGGAGAHGEYKPPNGVDSYESDESDESDDSDVLFVRANLALPGRLASGEEFTDNNDFLYPSDEETKESSPPHQSPTRALKRKHVVVMMGRDQGIRYRRLERTTQPSCGFGAKR